MKRILLYVVGAAIVIALALYAWIEHHERASADEHERRAREQEQALGPEVTVVAAETAPPTRPLALPGDVRPIREATVYARVSGYLDQLFVDRGDQVKAGQVLGRVATPETDRQLAPLVANLATKRAIADRLRPLVPKGVVAQQDLDRADADVQAAKADVDHLAALKGFDAVRAPFAGIVTQRYVDVGALMPAPTGATQSAQPLVDVADTSRVRIVIYAGQRDAPAIRVGHAVTITRDDDPTHPIQAAVTRIPDELDLRTRTMWVEIDIDNPNGRLVPGVYVTVTLHVPAQPGTLIPADAIALVAGKPSVAVVRDKRVHFVAIEVADDDGKTARVVRGVSPGDWIATRLSDELVDGGPVRPVRPEKQVAEGKHP